MFKKIAIAALAIGVGLLVLSRFSLVRVLWNDSKNWVARQVPPEVKLKEIRHKVDRLDEEIKKNLSRLAKMEVETQGLEEEVVALKDRQQKLRSDIAAMNQKLDGTTSRVAFQGKEYRVSDLSRKLDMAVVDYKNVKERLKGKEALLAQKKESLEISHNRISSMRNRKEEYRTLLARLETQIEQVKQKQLECRVEVDDSLFSDCDQMIADLQKQLKEKDKEAELQRKYGYASEVETPHDAKTPEEVRKSARAVLEEDEDAVVNGVK
jgi:chromosome segregation ATPase